MFFLSKLIEKLLVIVVFAALIAGCGQGGDDRMDLKTIHEKKVAEGFKHFHIDNPDDKPYNLVMLVEVRADGKFRICTAAYAKGARDTGDFEVYIKAGENGLHLHYSANGELVKSGISNFGREGMEFVVAPGSIAYGDFAAKLVKKSAADYNGSWRTLAPGESGFIFMTMFWDGEFAPDSTKVLGTLKVELQRLLDREK